MESFFKRAKPHDSVRCVSSGGHDMVLLTSIIFASERTLWESGIFSAGVKNAPSPEAGSGVSLPAKDNATTSPPPGRMGVGGVLRVS